jgi:hypothetical protein
MSKAIDVGDLPEPLVEAIESLISTYRMRAHSDDAAREGTPPIGWLKGKWELPDSFFDPLPDDVIDLFNGEETAG